MSCYAVDSLLPRSFSVTFSTQNLRHQGLMNHAYKLACEQGKGRKGEEEKGNLQEWPRISISRWCMIKQFSEGGGGAGVVTPSKPLPPYEQLLPLPTPCFRCFWKDPLMTPTPPPPHLKHLSLLFPPPPKKKILIIHMLVIWVLFKLTI